MKKAFREFSLKYRSGQSGMITVEVSVIVPIILFVIVGSIWFLMFLLDMSMAHSEIRRVAAETGHVQPLSGDIIYEDYEWRSLKDDNRVVPAILPPDLAAAAKERLLHRIRSRLSVARLTDIRISASGHYIFIHSGIRFPIPLRGVRRYLKSGGWEYHCNVGAVRNDREEMLRKYSRSYKEKGGATYGH